MKEQTGKRRVSILLTAVLVISLLCGNSGSVMGLYSYGRSRKTNAAVLDNTGNSSGTASVSNAKQASTASPSELDDGTVSDAKPVTVPSQDGTELNPVSISWDTSNRKFTLHTNIEDGTSFVICYAFAPYKTYTAAEEFSSLPEVLMYPNDEVDLETKIEKEPKFRIYAFVVQDTNLIVSNTIAHWDYPDDVSSVDISWPDADYFELESSNSTETAYYCITDYGVELDNSTLWTNGTEYTGPVDMTQYVNKEPFRIHTWLGALNENNTNKTLTYEDYPCALPKITADHKSGPIVKGTAVSLTCADDAGNPPDEIRYTLNDDTPTAESALYTGPITINEDTVIRARAFYENVSEGWTPVVSAFRYTVPGGKTDRYEINDTLSQATDISFPSQTEAMISTAADKDFYRFTIGSAYAGKPFILSLTPPGR